MSNLARKIEKNKIEILENTPCFTRREFNNKCKEIDRNIQAQYTEKLRKVCKNYSEALQQNTTIIEKRYCVEFIFELLNQMECFNEDCEFKEEKIEACEKMYNNVIERLHKYNSYKKPEKEVAKKVNKILKICDLVFED